MEPSLNSGMYGTRIVIIVLALVLALSSGAGYYYYMHYYLPSEKQSATIIFNKNFAYVKSGYFSGDYTGSVQKILDLLPNAPNKDAEGYLKIFLAAAYLKSDQQPDDRSNGIGLYKGVINDPDISPKIRALALNDVATLVLNNDISFYQLYFPEAPYNSYIPATGSDYIKLRTVYFSILKLSDQTYPTSAAEYAIAGNYFAPMVANGAIQQPAAISDAAKEMQSYIAQGDSRDDALLYSSRMIVQNLLYRATGFAYSSSLLGLSNISTQEQSYKDLLQKEADFASQNDPAIYRTTLFTRFYYASFLMNRFGTERDSDIKTILKPFAQAPSLSDSPLFQKTPYLQKQLSKLSVISPDLGKYLTAIAYMP